MPKLVQLLIFGFLLLLFSASSPLHNHHTLHYQPLSLLQLVSVNTSLLVRVIRIDFCNVNCVFSWLKCVAGYEPLPPHRPAAIAAPVWQDRTIASAKLRLLEYSAFLETQRDRETVQTFIEYNALPKNKSFLSFLSLLFPSDSINIFLYTSAHQTRATMTLCWSP